MTSPEGSHNCEPTFAFFSTCGKLLAKAENHLSNVWGGDHLVIVQPLILQTEHTAGPFYAFSLTHPETQAGQPKQDPQEGLSGKVGCKRKTMCKRFE